MATLFDYLAWRGDLSFKQSPFNPVDNVIFSQLSYLPLDGIVPSHDEKEEISVCHAAELFKEKLEKNTDDIKSSVMFKDDPLLIETLASSQRFGNCKLFGYVNHIDSAYEIQFSALCVDTGDDSCFVVYRGTDLSFVGWKEDFNMGFKEVIPSQIASVKYLEKMYPRLKVPLRVGGHSKGGNLAVYAAANCDKKIQKNITVIYSNDAPGFHENFIKSEGFLAIKDRIRAFVPHESIVGMFFERGSDYTVIKSSKSGILQHELFSWEVAYNDMIHVEDITSGSRFVDKTLKDWISALDNEKREQFINALYSILCSTEVKSIAELEKSWFKSSGLMLKSFHCFDEDTKKFLRTIVGNLFNAARRNIDTLFKPN